MKIEEMLELRLEGLTCAQIGQRSGCTMAQVSRLTNLLYRARLAKKRSDADVAMHGLAATHIGQLGLPGRVVTALQNAGACNVKDALTMLPDIIADLPAPRVGRSTAEQLRLLPETFAKYVESQRR